MGPERSRARRLALAALASLAVAAALVLVLVRVPGAAAPGLEDEDARGGLADEAGAASVLPAVQAELDRRLVLRSLPGVAEALPTGRGVVLGAVKVHAAGEPARPLPGVEVLLLSAQAGRSGAAPLRATSGTDGAFVFEAVPAPATYALVIQQPPWREVVRMGQAVASGHTLDLGDILLGAPTSLAGEVVDASGRPVAGATVQVLADRSRPDSLDLLRALAEVQAAGEPLAEARASAQGTFVVAGLAPGRYLLRVSAPGYASTFRGDVRVTVDERAGGVRVVLDPGAGWRGTVRDSEGRGVAGARLVALAMRGESSARTERVDTTAAADGTYRLDSLVAGVRYYVEAWGEALAPEVFVAVAEGVAERDLVLRAAGRVEGRVRDGVTGQPVAGAQVTLLGREFALMSASTDAGGAYVLPAVPPGTPLLFTARAGGWLPHARGGNDLAGQQVVAGATLVLDAVLERGGRVEGRLLGPDGRGVPYASVALAPPGRRMEGEVAAVTAVDGGYVLEGLRAGSHEVRVTAPGYAPTLAEGDGTVQVPTNDAVVRHDIRLVEGGALEGSVRTAEGTPVAGAQVEVSAVAAALRGRVRDLVVVSDGAGGWRVVGVPSGVDLRVVARHDGWAPAEQGPLRLREGQRQSVDLVLGPGATLPLRVQDEGGRPLGGARVRWGMLGPGSEEHVQRGDAYRADGALGTRVLLTDREGRVRIEHLEPGRLLLRVELEGYSDFYRQDLVIPASGDASERVVTLVGALSVEGRVTAREGGQPIAGAWVYAEEDRPGAEQPQDPGRIRALVATQADAQGRYRLDRLPPQPCTVVVWLALGYEGQRQAGVRPGARVDFTLVAQPPPAPPAAR